MSKKELNFEFEREINKTNIVNLNLIEYLKESLKSDNKNYCNGWDYLKENLTEELKRTLTSFDYWSKSHNKEKVKVILNDYLIIHGQNYALNEKLKKQLGSFVYVWNDKKREIEEKIKEKCLKEYLLKRGFKEQGVLNKEKLKKLNGLKVKCVLDISKIGLLGSFNKKEEIEGRLIWSNFQNNLIIIPKRCRTRCFIIRKKFYFKELKRRN